jgi:hypothetical protein
MKKHTLVASADAGRPGVLDSGRVAVQDGDRDQRAALEREALERELELALQPDTTVEPELTDVALPPRGGGGGAGAGRRRPQRAVAAGADGPQPAQRSGPGAHAAAADAARAEPGAGAGARPRSRARPRLVSVPVGAGTTHGAADHVRS